MFVIIGGGRGSIPLPMRGHERFDQERWVPEPPGNPERSAFERDRARVLHSAALRRLARTTTLLAASGNPWTSAHGAKFGVYPDDRPVFDWVRQGLPAGRVRFEAQVMDWSDDGAYSVHDLEDALHAGHVTPALLRDPAERRDVCERTLKWYAGDACLTELEETLDNLTADPHWPSRFDGTMADLVALKSFTSALIGRFCLSAQAATLEAYGPGVAGGGADLIVPRVTRLECALLKGATAHYVMSTEDHNANQVRQRELIAELASMIMLGAPGTLEPALRAAFAEAADDAARLRVVVDQIASLTDVSAVALHRGLGARL